MLLTVKNGILVRHDQRLNNMNMDIFYINDGHTCSGSDNHHKLFLSIIRCNCYFYRAMQHAFKKLYHKIITIPTL